MSSSSRSRCSMMKHSGALMSSRLMPPQDLPRNLTQLMNSSGSSVLTSRSMRIDVGETLEQHRLAFHHRLGGERAAIAEPQDRGAVGDDGDEIALGRVVVGEALILGDRQHRHRDAGRIGERQVALRRHRLGGDDLELARPPLAVKKQRFLVGECRPDWRLGFFVTFQPLNGTATDGPDGSPYRNALRCLKDVTVHCGTGREE